jgi:ABC-2 type transport system permease protein
MIRLIQLEWLKAKPARFFWILLLIYMALLISVPISVQGLSDWIIRNFLPENLALDNVNLFYDFQDIWQNFTFVFQYFSVFLGTLIIIHVAREFSLKTARQNIIDGLSKSEFVWSKVLFIAFIAALITLFVALLALLFGALFSPSVGTSLMFENVHFLGAYYLHLVQDMLFAMFIAMLVRRPGIAVVVYLFYAWLESFAHLVIKHALGWDLVAKLLPNTATKGMIHTPMYKYVLQPVQTYVAWEDLAISVGYIGIFIFLSMWMMKRRDL